MRNKKIAIIGMAGLGISVANILRFGIDPAELATVLEKDPAIQKVAAEALGKAKFVVRSEADETAFKTNFEKEVIDRVIPERIRAVHDQYDKDLKEVFGDKFTKNQNEHTYEALKRVGKSYLGELSGKIATLEDQIKKGDPTGALTKQLQEAEDKYKAELAKRDTEINTLKGANENAAKSVAMQSAYTKIAQKFIKTLPPFFNETKDTILNSILKDSILKDGELYVGENGVIKRDASFKEIKVEDFLGVKFKDVIDTKPIQGGAGSAGAGGANRIDPSKWTVETYELPAGVSTPAELMRKMAEDGLVKGTDLYNKIFANLVNGNTGKLKGVS